MIRAAILLAALAASLPAHADNNPFSGATSISVTMTRDRPAKFKSRRDSDAAGKLLRASKNTFRLHCTLNGKPINWKEMRVNLDGETLTVLPDAAGPMILLLWAGGAKCERR